MAPMYPGVYPGYDYNAYMMSMMGGMPWYTQGSAASFHLPTPKNEIKLFVGAL